MNNKIKMNKMSEKTHKSLINRILVSVIFAVVGIPCLVLGGWFYLGIVAILVALATFEIVRAPMKNFNIFVIIISFIVMFALVFWGSLRTAAIDYMPLLQKGESINFVLETVFRSIYVSPIAICVMAGVFFVIIIAKEDFVINDATYLISMILIIAIAFQCVLLLRFLPFTMFDKSLISANEFKYFQSTLLLIYTLIGVMINDIGAYFVGILFGKKKINPRISPSKTFEGFFSGVVFSFTFSLIFALVCAHFNYPILPCLNIANWYWILLISFSMPLIANLGDFTFSAFKRTFNIKDYSKVFGQHGGVLDRFDSLFFTSIAVVIFVTFISNGWNFLL